MGKILIIALNTYRESIRSKILYSVIFFAVVLMAVSSFFGSVTIGDQVVVIKDFGLLSVSLFSAGFAVISGSALLSKELSKKTVYNILAKSVHRYEFLLGKYLGMYSTVVVLVALMGAGLSAFVFIFDERGDFLMFKAYLFILFELIIVCAYAIFFSAIVVTPLLSGLFTFGIFLAGRSVEHIWSLLEKTKDQELLFTLLNFIYYALPHLSSMNVSNEVVYGIEDGVNGMRILYCFSYAVGYSMILLLLSSLIFKRREFN